MASSGSPNRGTETEVFDHMEEDEVFKRRESLSRTPPKGRDRANAVAGLPSGEPETNAAKRRVELSVIPASKGKRHREEDEDERKLSQLVENVAALQRLCETPVNTKVEINAAVRKLHCEIQDYKERWGKQIRNAKVGKAWAQLDQERKL